MEVKVNLTLTVLDNDSIFPAIRVITLSPRNPFIVVGRASRSPIKALHCAADNAWIDSPVISRNHAIITLDSKRQSLTLQDTGSMHGTYLNDFQMTSHNPADLYNGDKVTFGAEVKRGSMIFAACTLQVNFDFSPYMETNNFVLSESSDSDDRFSQSDNDEQHDISEFVSRIGRGFTKASFDERSEAANATESYGPTLYSKNQNNFYEAMNHVSQLETHQKTICLENNKHGIQAGTPICDSKLCTKSSAIIRDKNDFQFSSDSFFQYLGGIKTGLCNSENFQPPNTLGLRNKDISLVPFSCANDIDTSLSASAYFDGNNEKRRFARPTSRNELHSSLYCHNSRYKLSRNTLDDDLASHHKVSSTTGNYKYEDKPYLKRSLQNYSQSKSISGNNSISSSQSSMTLLASPSAEYFSPSPWEKSSFSHDVTLFRTTNRDKNISQGEASSLDDSNKNWSRTFDDGIDKSFYLKSRELNKANFHSMACKQRYTPMQPVRSGRYLQQRNSGNQQASRKGYNYISLATALYDDKKKSSAVDNSIIRRYFSLDKSEDSKCRNLQPSSSPDMSYVKPVQNQSKYLTGLLTKDTHVKDMLETNEASDLVSVRQIDGTKRKFGAISKDSDREQDPCSPAEVQLREHDVDSLEVFEASKPGVKAETRPKKRQRYLEKFGYAALGGIAAAAGLFSLLVTTAPDFS